MKNLISVTIVLSTLSSVGFAADKCKEAIRKVAITSGKVGSITGQRDFVANIPPAGSYSLDVEADLKKALSDFQDAVAEASQNCTDKN